MGFSRQGYWSAEKALATHSVRHSVPQTRATYKKTSKIGTLLYKDSMSSSIPTQRSEMFTVSIGVTSKYSELSHHKGYKSPAQENLENSEKQGHSPFPSTI